MTEHTEYPPPSRVGEPQPNGLSDRVRSLRLGSGSGKSGSSSGSGRGSLLAWGLAGIFFVAANGFGFLAYLRTPSEASTSSASPGADKTAADGTPTQKTASSGDVLLEAKGYVIAAHQIQVSPEVNGKLVWIDPRFKEGALFKENEILAKVDPVIYRARRDRARAALEDAKAAKVDAIAAKLDAEATLANLLETGSRPEEIKQKAASVESLRAVAQQMADRLRFIDDSKLAVKPEERTDTENMRVKAVADHIATQAELDALRRRTVTEIRSAQAKVQSTQAKIEQCAARIDVAQADLTEAEKQLYYCDIRAPVSGKILKKNAEKGNLVNPVGFNISSSLCDMADLGDLEIELDIQERDISRITVGGPAFAMPEAFARDDTFLKKHPKGYEGVYERFMPIANRGKGAITVRVKVRVSPEEEGVYLLPDMGVIVSFKK